MKSNNLKSRIDRLEQLLETTDHKNHDYNGNAWKLARTIYGDRVARKLHEKAPYRPFGLLTIHEIRALLGKDDGAFKRLSENPPIFWQDRLEERRGLL